MKKLLFWAVFLTTMLILTYTLSNSLSTPSKTSFTITSTSLFSTSVADTYKITIAVPDDYETTLYPYPTIYLLDAEYHFNGTHPYVGCDVGPGGVLGIIEELIEKNYIPPCVLVGIGYDGIIDTQRYRDFRNNRSPFYNFIKYELLPFVDTNYQTNITDRTLIGHSLGGTFTTYCLFQYNLSNPILFKRFITLSGNYRKDVFDALAAESTMYESIIKSTNPSVDASVFLAVGGQDDPLFVSGNKNLTIRLNERNYSDLRFNGTIYENYDHRTVVRPGFTEGLKWVFSNETVETESSNSVGSTTNYSNIDIFTLLIVVVVVRFITPLLLSKKRLQ